MKNGSSKSAPRTVPQPEATQRAATAQQPPIAREEIAALAKRRWQESGSPPGRDAEFWLAAESELKLQRAGVEQAVRGQGDPAPGTPA